MVTVIRLKGDDIFLATFFHRRPRSSPVCVSYQQLDTQNLTFLMTPSVSFMCTVWLICAQCGALPFQCIALIRNHICGSLHVPTEYCG